MEKKRLSKLNPDEGFSSFENATFRKYGKLTAQIKPDMQTYAENKEKAGDAFYATVGTVVHGVHKVNHKQESTFLCKEYVVPSEDLIQ